MKAVVFGGTGFIGSHVVEQLQLAGHQVTVVVRDSSDTTFLEQLDVNVVMINFADTTAIGKAIEGNEVVYNCTADTNKNQIQMDTAVEIQLTRTLMERAASHGAARFVQLSTIVLYDFRSEEPIDESYISEPQNSIQRLAMEREKIIEQVAKSTGIETFVLRPASTIGTRDQKSFFARLFKAHRNNQYPMIGNGDTKVSLVDTRDIGRAMVWLGTVEKPEQDNGIYLLKGFDTTWGELKRKMDQAIGSVSKVIQIPVNLTDEQLSEYQLNSYAIKTFSVNRIWIDDKIRKLGFAPKYSFSDAVYAEVNDLLSRNVL